MDNNDARVNLAPLKQVEEHRAKICIEKICEFMKDQERGIGEIHLLEFQQWIGRQIISMNGNLEYEKYRKKYREKRKCNNLSKKEI